MPGSDEITTTSVEFVTTDGAELVGEAAVPYPCRAAAIICHPHPQYGGNRFNNVVTALFDALPAVGVAALRFDFRREFGGGVAEVDDARAALDAIATAVPGVPILATGYSFGAVVALHVTDDRLSGKVLVAPPLGMMGESPAPDEPTLVLTPAADQFCPPDVAEPIVSAWPHAEFTIVETADHFLAGRTEAVAAGAIAWIDRLLA